MESRARFAIGGVATVVASVAVVCAVALTNSVALADAAGTPIGAERVVVPSSGATAASPTPTATLPTPAPTAPIAEIVPAPAPVVVDQSVQSADRPPPQPTEADVVARAEASGSWDVLREWASARGWSKERVDQWIADREQWRSHRSEESNGDDRGDHRGDGDDGRPQSTGHGDDPHSHGRDDASDSSRRSSPQHSSPQRPAMNAGSITDDRSDESGRGAKKDQSRPSPAWRD